MAKSHLCAGENVIGPISDVEHVSKIPGDAEEVMETLTEMKNIREEQFDILYNKMIESDGEFDETNWEQDEDFRRMLKRNKSTYQDFFKDDDDDIKP